MPREITWGTPSRSGRYLPLRKRGDLLLLALLAGGLVAGVLLAAQATGARAAISPGPISSGHGPLAESCDACHARGGVAGARCARCHDPAGSERLAHAAHVAVSRPGPAAPAEPSCDRCHGEHRGRDARLSDVPSSECAQCHFRSFAAHPQFAVVREKRGEHPGLRFDHSSHIALIAEAKGGGGSAICTRCHEPSAQSRDFAPLSFERHCGGCHEGFEHRDPRILTGWHALRRQLDPQGFLAERAALRERKASLEDRLARIGRPRDGGDPPPSVLTLEARKQLEQSIEETDARLKLVCGDAPEAARAPLSEAARAQARLALDRLSEPCRSCHPPMAEGAFAPVRAARSVLHGAAFHHAPHLVFSDCARCHASVAQSREADELHLEGVETCKGCHGAAGVADECRSCHRYHPRASW
jgi:hypothetical protein